MPIRSTRHPIRQSVARWSHDTRIALGRSLQVVAASAHITPSYLWAIEQGRANPTLDVVERIAAALQVDLQLVGPPPILQGRPPRQRDLVHAWASAYADRRLRNGGWETAREVEIVHGRSHGWID